MRREHGVKLYNILLPIWMLIFWPSWLWLLLIPANYIIDRIVLRWSLGDMPDRGAFCRKHTWKICLVGFLADFIGACLLLGMLMILTLWDRSSSLNDFWVGFETALCVNPFANIAALLFTLLSIAASGAVIYLLDRLLLKKCGLDASKARKSALRLALITAPYLYLFPSGLLYGSKLF